MTKAKQAKVPSGQNVMQIPGDPANREQLLAGLTAEGLFTNAILMQSFSTNLAGPIGITEAVQALRKTIKEVSRGDLSAAETVLVGQAAALNAMFAELARRAALNMGEHMSATETYMRLALKAQSQCRATLETLAAIKNPPMVFARQMNVAHGPQQVNNAAVPNSTPASAHPGETVSRPTELLEGSTHGGAQLDTRATAAAGRTNQGLEPVGAINRAAHP